MHAFTIAGLSKVSSKLSLSTASEVAILLSQFGCFENSSKVNRGGKTTCLTSSSRLSHCCRIFGSPALASWSWSGMGPHGAESPGNVEVRRRLTVPTGDSPLIPSMVALAAELLLQAGGFSLSRLFILIRGDQSLTHCHMLPGNISYSDRWSNNITTWAIIIASRYLSRVEKLYRLRDC